MAVARLWDRGEAIDEMVLGYTAGEDYLLDDRLVTLTTSARPAPVDAVDAARGRAPGRERLQPAGGRCHAAARRLALPGRRGASPWRRRIATRPRSRRSAWWPWSAPRAGRSTWDAPERPGPGGDPALAQGRAGELAGRRRPWRRRWTDWGGRRAADARVHPPAASHALDRGVVAGCLCRRNSRRRGRPARGAAPGRPQSAWLRGRLRDPAAGARPGARRPGPSASPRRRNR